MPKQKKAICVANGDIKNFRIIKKILADKFNFYEQNSNFFIIAADGGALNCFNLDLIPDVIIGDMDSITTDVVLKLNKKLSNKNTNNYNLNKNKIENMEKIKKKEISFVNYKQDKDESDTQLALDYLVDLGFNNILILGAFGSRIDHSLANLLLLCNPKYENTEVKIITEENEIFVLQKSGTIKSEIGKKISIFSMTPYTYFIKTLGLKYSLKDEKLLFSPIRGLSNEFTKNSAKIMFSEGKILIIKEL